MLGHELRNPLAPILTALQPDGAARRRGARAGARDHRAPGRAPARGWSTTCSTSRASRAARSSCDASASSSRRRGARASSWRARCSSSASTSLDGRACPTRACASTATDAPRAGASSNLLTNAAQVHAAAAGASRRRLRGTATSVVLIVRDNGIGIAPELLPRLFDLFVQGGRPLDRSQGGLGLGLAIVRSLVELHGGTVERAQRRAGQGSEFTVRLPRARRRAGGRRRSTASRAAPRADASAAASWSSTTTTTRRSCSPQALDALGPRDAHRLRRPERARAGADSSRPRSRCSTSACPSWTATSWRGGCAQIAGCRRLRLIAVTGYGQARDRERCAAAGFDAHLVKPVDVAPRSSGY